MSLGLGLLFVGSGLPWLQPSGDERVSYRFRVTTPTSRPLAGVAVLGVSGETLGTSDTAGLVTIRDQWSASRWYFKPSLDVAAAQSLESPPPLVQGLWKHAAASERRRWLQSSEPTLVVLPDLLAPRGPLAGGAQPEDLRASGAKPAGWIRDETWSLLSEWAPNVSWLPSFAEQDIPEPGALPATNAPGASASAASVAGASAETPGNQALTASQMELTRAAQDSMHVQSQGTEPRPGSDPSLQAAAAGGDGEDLGSEGPSSQGPSDDKGLRVSESDAGYDTGLGFLRLWDGRHVASARAQAASGHDLAGGVSDLSSGTASKGSEDDGDPSQAWPAGGLQYPPELRVMDGWAVPQQLVRRVYLEVKRRSDAQDEAVKGAPSATRTKIFAISTTKGIEVFLGEPTESGTFAVKVPDSLRLDVLRVEHADCGGIVLPLLASSQRSPQALGCPGSEHDRLAEGSTLAVVYEAHGLYRYFVGGHLESGGSVGDVGSKVSLFRVPMASSSGRVSELRFRHPDVAGGSQELRSEILPVHVPLVEDMLSARGGTLLARPREGFHRVFVVAPKDPVRPRVSLRFERGRTPQRMDNSLVDRFERALMASFVNAKPFVPVPWSSLERQSGISWNLDLADQGGWKGTVLDYLLDYCLTVVPQTEGVTATWFDRFGTVRWRRTLAYLDGVPPELLARDVFDVATENIPNNATVRTATR